MLHEDKQYYPSAEDVYGPGTEALVMEEDAQPIEVPILAPVKVRKVEAPFPPIEPRAPPAFAAALLATPALVRTVAVLGGLHAGKTCLVDTLVAAACAGFPAPKSNDAAAPRYTDARLDEQARRVSLKATPISLVLPSGTGKSHLLQLVDAPGHPDVHGEAVAALRLADGALLCVDAAEGVTASAEAHCAAAAAAGARVVLVITKVDRLATELKLPPADAYHKLRHVLEEANAAAAGAGLVGAGGGARAFDPRAGTCAFSSAAHGWSFTLPSFAALYADVAGEALDTGAFAARLWGDSYFNGASRKFSRAAPTPGAPRSFVQFVLEPLYKLIAHALAEDAASLAGALESVGVSLPRAAYAADVKPLIAAVTRAVLGGPAGLVDAILATVPDPRAGAAAKASRVFGPTDDAASAAALASADPAAPLVAAIAKLIPKPDATGFDALVRVFAGTLRPGDRVRVLGPAFTPADAEDCAPAAVGRLWTLNGRERTPLDAAPAGAWALVEGVDATVTGAGATLAAAAGPFPPAARPLAVGAGSVVKLACEPLQPGELPSMVAGLRAVAKSYPAARVRVEESGEHVLMGPGELFLDSAMKVRGGEGEARVGWSAGVPARAPTSPLPPSRRTCASSTATSRSKWPTPPSRCARLSRKRRRSNASRGPPTAPTRSP